MSFASFTRSARASSAEICAARAVACGETAGASVFCAQAPSMSVTPAVAAKTTREMRKFVTSPPESCNRRPRYGGASIPPTAEPRAAGELNGRPRDKRLAVRYCLPLGQLAAVPAAPYTEFLDANTSSRQHG